MTRSLAAAIAIYLSIGFEPAYSFVCQFAPSHMSFECVEGDDEPAFARPLPSDFPAADYFTRRSAFVQSVPALEEFRRAAESFRDFVESYRRDAEAIRRQSAANLALYEAMILFYYEADSEYQAMIDAYHDERDLRLSRRYTCDFDSAYTKVVCRREASGDIAVEFDIRIGRRATSLISGDGTYRLTKQDAEFFRIECEQFGKSLAALVVEAENIRRERPEDLPLYREVMRFHALGRDYYSALDDAYDKVVFTGFGV